MAGQCPWLQQGLGSSPWKVTVGEQGKNQIGVPSSDPVPSHMASGECGVSPTFFTEPPGQCVCGPCPLDGFSSQTGHFTGFPAGLAEAQAGERTRNCSHECCFMRETSQETPRATSSPDPVTTERGFILQPGSFY